MSTWTSNFEKKISPWTPSTGGAQTWNKRTRLEIKKSRVLTDTSHTPIYLNNMYEKKTLWYSIEREGTFVRCQPTQRNPPTSATKHGIVTRGESLAISPPFRHKSWSWHSYISSTGQNLPRYWVLYCNYDPSGCLPIRWFIIRWCDMRVCCPQWSERGFARNLYRIFHHERELCSLGAHQAELRCYDTLQVSWPFSSVIFYILGRVYYGDPSVWGSGGPFFVGFD